MHILDSVEKLRSWRKARSTDKIGFVPTMGALHAGHGSLFESARKESDVVIASIFVNPTQFNDPEDLKRYPRTIEKDSELLKSLGVDTLFIPNAAELYRDDYRYQVNENKISLSLCGASRPGHFDGVLTVVLKLLNLVQPARAYFGEKDFQQLSLIRGMVEAFFLDVEIVPCRTVREGDGLAMSSRNLLLTPEEREIAPRLYRIIRESSDTEQAKFLLTREGFKVDYVEDRDGRRFAAAFLGKVRLIDNVEL